VAEHSGNLVTVARALQRLGLTEAVFVGGATVELHLTDSASLAPRVTLDVDLVVDASTRHRFNALEKALSCHPYNHPWSRAIRAASTRLAAPSLPIASDR
jgi:hypothetical protein